MHINIIIFGLLCAFVGALWTLLIVSIYSKRAKKKEKKEVQYEILCTENGILMRPIGSEEWEVMNTELKADIFIK